MRVLILIGVITIATALSTGGAVLLVLQADGPGDWLWLALTANLGLTIPPLSLGSILAFWDMGRSDAARRAYRRTLALAVGMQVIAVAALSAYVALTSASWWVIPLFTAVGVGLSACAIRVGPVLRRLEAPSSLRADGAVYSRTDLRRDLRRIVTTALVTAAVVSVGVAALSLTLNGGDEGVWGLAAYVGIFALMGAGIACALVSARIGRQQRDLVDGDLGRMRDIGKVVVTAKKREEDLRAEDAEVAPRFAALSAVTQTYQAGWLLSLFLALGSMQVMRAIEDPTDLLAIGVAAFSGLALLTFGPLIAIQLRRTRRYAIEHGETILEPRESTAARST